MSHAGAVLMLVSGAVLGGMLFGLFLRNLDQPMVWTLPIPPATPEQQARWDHLLAVQKAWGRVAQKGWPLAAVGFGTGVLLLLSGA